MTRKEQREQNKKKLHKNIIITILVIIAILALVYIIYQIYNNKKDEKQYEELAETMDVVSEENINEKPSLKNVLRMKEIIMDIREEPPRDIGRGILERVLGYSDYRARDDMTVLVAGLIRK